MAHVLHHSRASGTPKVVLLGIANHDGDGGAWPSIDTLARYANVDRRSVKRAIRALEALGEVVVYANDGGHRGTPNDRRPNRYEITVPIRATPDARGDARVTPSRGDAGDVHGGTPVSARGDAGVHHGVTPTSPEPSMNLPEPSEEPSTRDERAGDDVLLPADAVAAPDPFETFWRAFPTVRGTKAEARKAWPQAVKRAGGPATIIAGAERYRDDPNRVDQYTAGAAVWLRRDGWTEPPLPQRGARQMTTEERMRAAAAAGRPQGDPWAQVGRALPAGSAR